MMCPIRGFRYDDPIPWLTSTYDNLTPFSAVCYYFGKALHKRMAAEGEVVPIGLLKVEWGGSLIESWVPDRSHAGASRHGR